MNKLLKSSFALGCHRLYDGFERNKSYSIVKAALDNGITHFDTAPRYGDSEKLIGKFLQNEKVTISSKVGLDPIIDSQIKKNLTALKRGLRGFFKDNIPYSKEYYDKKLCKKYINSINELKDKIHAFNPQIVLTEKHIRNSLHQSLQNLQRETLDILFLHEPDNIINKDEVIDIFKKIQKEGLIIQYGFAFHRWLKPNENYSEDINLLSMFEKNLLEKKDFSSSFIHGAMGYYKFGINKQMYIDYPTPIDFIQKLSKLHPNKTFLLSPSNKKQLIGLNK